MEAFAQTSDLSPLIWRDGQPRSRLFGDIYYSLEDGLAESRAVFLAGCGLPEAWAGRRRYTVAELGFGSGLNIAALLHLWNETRPDGGRLHVFSIEGFPLDQGEARQALSSWPEISQTAEALLGQWATKRRGMHRIDLPQYGATIDVAIADVEPALSGWSGKADAWFLDGFSPALNPQMWRDEVLALVGAQSAPGAVAATFTVAGQVRRGLAAAGFEVSKAPGHGRKRERLEARMPGEPAPVSSPRVAVIGAGIAGASLARAFDAMGIAAQVFEARSPGAGASGNRAALVMPALDAGNDARSHLYAQAFTRAVQLYDAVSGAVLSRGAVQVEAAERDARRFDSVAAQDIFTPGAVHRLNAAKTAERLAEPVALGGLAFDEGRVVAPGAVLEAWIAAVHSADIVSLRRSGGVWRLESRAGESFEAEVVVLANGWQGAALAEMPIAPVRGQASFCEVPGDLVASASGAYAVPAPGGVLFGATHDRGETGDDARPQDDARNLTALAAIRPNLAAHLWDKPISGRASVRGTTPDRMPLAGEIEPGLFILAGLGSRGFATAPLLAEHIAAIATETPSPLPADLAERVDPLRFRRP